MEAVMHEMSLAVSLVRRVEAEAGKAQMLKVTGVDLEVGALQSVEPELLVDAFRAASLGTLAEGADLHLNRVRAEACCLICGEVYEPAFADYQCPACGQAEPQILRGRDLVLTAVTGETGDGGGNGAGKG
jgi:hydrogenase nickel incorporation protein HypA/HybF